MKRRGDLLSLAGGRGVGTRADLRFPVERLLARGGVADSDAP